MQRQLWKGTPPEGIILSDHDWREFKQNFTFAWMTTCPWWRNATVIQIDKIMVTNQCERCRFLAGLMPSATEEPQDDEETIQ